MTALIVTLPGCGVGSGSLPNASIPPTPTASTHTQKAGPAYDLLRQSQQAMLGVTSYHFRLDNSVDRNTVEMDRLAGDDELFQKQTMYEGDVEPPVARYWPNTDITFSKMVVVGTDMYQRLWLGEGYRQMNPSGASWYYWSNTGGLNNPQEFINFTLDKAQCATILGEEPVDGAATVHARYNLINDQIGARTSNGDYVYVRDYWIDKNTHYIRRLQTHEISNNWGPCEQSFSWDDDAVRYTTGILTYSNFNVPISPPLR